MKAIWILILIFCGVASCFAQDEADLEKPWRKVSKISFYPLFYDLPVNGDFKISLYQEFAPFKNNKFTLGVALDYSNTTSKIFFNGMLVAISKNFDYAFRPHLRYYLGKAPINTFEGVFVGVTGFLDYQDRISGTVEAYSFGVGAISGYQFSIGSRFTLDSEIFLGVVHQINKQRNFAGQLVKREFTASKGRVRVSIGYKF